VVRIAHSLSSMRATLLNPDFAALNPGYGWKDLSALDWAADDRSSFGQK
jgi:hypothetical protein